MKRSRQLAALILGLVFLGSATTQVDTVISGQGGLDALTLDPQGRIYVSQPNANRVLRIDDGTVETFFEGLQFPLGHSFDADGNFLASSGPGLLRRDTAGNVTTVATGFSLVAGHAQASDGRLFVADYNLSRISAVDTDGVVTLIAQGGELNGPAGLALDSVGRLYAGNFNDGKIIRIGTDGTQTVIAQPDVQVGYITIANDIIFATLFDANRVEQVSLDGDVVPIAGAGTFGTTDGAVAEATFQGVNGIVALPDGRFLLVSEFAAAGGMRRIDLETSDFEINEGVSGVWFFPETSGSGFLFDFEPVSGFFFAAWFTYSQGGERDWLKASGAAIGSGVDATVFTSTGGRFDDPAAVTTVAAGSLNVAFSGCSNGEVTYALDDGRRGTLPIVRVIPDSEKLCEALAATR